MINFRFHIASLIAVFLALALGVVMGSTVVQRAIVEGLRDRIDKVDQRADSVQAKNDALQTEIDRLNLYAAESAPFAVSGELTDQTVAVLAERGLNEDAVKAQVEVLRMAGARVAGILWLESAWNLTEDGTADALRAATGSTTRNARTLRNEALDALAGRAGPGRGQWGSGRARQPGQGRLRQSRGLGRRGRDRGELSGDRGAHAAAGRPAELRHGARQRPGADSGARRRERTDRGR